MPLIEVRVMRNSSPGRSNGSGRNSTPLTSLKTVVVPPTPTARGEHGKEGEHWRVRELPDRVAHLSRQLIE